MPADAAARRRAALTLDAAGASPTCSTAIERAAATSRSATLWSPGYFRVDLARGPATATLVASTESLGRRSTRSSPDEAAQAELERRRRLLEQRRTVARATASPRELVLAADQFIITPAGRAEDAARARAAGDEARTVIAGYHWFTDWGRDTMISLEGLTLVDRPASRGGLHPPHLRALRPRRPDPEHVPRRGEAKASITPPTRRCGSSTPSIATSHATGDRDTLRHAAPELRRHRRASPARARGSASASIRPTACCARAPRATSSPGWTRRSTTGSSRRGAARRSRSTRSGTTRCACSSGWTARAGGGRGGRRCAGHADRRARVVQPAVLVRGGRLPLRRRRRRATATTRRAGRTSSSRSRSTIRCSTARAGQPVLDVVQRAAADAGRPALARARASRTTSRTTTAICARATRPTTRARCGPG